MNIKKYISLVSILAIASSFALAMPVFSENNQQNENNKNEVDVNRMRPNVVGKVSAVNGTILTVISKQGFNINDSATTTFTIDATNAKLLRGDTTIIMSDIAVDDTVVVQGTITGNNVVATVIRDGRVGNGNEGDNNQALLQIQGDGQPIIAGTISVITGSTLTVVNANVTYTVNAVSAKILQGTNVVPISSVKTGDSVIVQGIVNGTNIIASTIIDQTKPAGTTENSGKKMGFFGSIGQWFRHLFGF